jgi:hypothetical protein
MSPPQEIIKATAVVGGSTFPTMQYRKTFTAAGFGNWFRDGRNETGLLHCSAHGVRKACTRGQPRTAPHEAAQGDVLDGCR